MQCGVQHAQMKQLNAQKRLVSPIQMQWKGLLTSPPGSSSTCPSPYILS
jgi:hypothetical protein